MENSTERELIQEIRSKEEEINRLIEEAHLRGLKPNIQETKKRVSGKGRGRGSRIDIIGHEAPQLLLTFLK